MQTYAVVMEGPQKLAVRRVGLTELGDHDVMVDVAWSGVSTGTERLLWTGRMPPFPGLSYPLVPGYESVGRVVDAGRHALHRVGEAVFVPGATCYADAKGLFGGAAHRIFLPSERAIALPDNLAEDGVLFALAATAFHAIAGGDGAGPDLIVGHGVLGRLLARIAIARGGPAPVVWETNPMRRDGAQGYDVIDPADDDRRDYRAIYDVSGAADLLDTLIGRLARGGEVVLAGFYDKPVSFAFPQAFMREARLRVAAEWKPDDIAATAALIEAGALSFGGLVTHHTHVGGAEAAYRTAFEDAACLKMVVDWRGSA
jgi:3-hydroxyethyl bacteriochlorophyllide a dehydrogenase